MRDSQTAALSGEGRRSRSISARSSGAARRHCVGDARLPQATIVSEFATDAPTLT